MSTAPAIVDTWRAYNPEYVTTGRRRKMAARKLEDAAQALLDAAYLLDGLNVPGTDCDAWAVEVRTAANFSVNTAMRIR